MHFFKDLLCLMLCGFYLPSFCSTLVQTALLLQLDRLGLPPLHLAYLAVAFLHAGASGGPTTKVQGNAT